VALELHLKDMPVVLLHYHRLMEQVVAAAVVRRLLVLTAPEITLEQTNVAEQVATAWPQALLVHQLREAAAAVGGLEQLLPGWGLLADQAAEALEQRTMKLEQMETQIPVVAVAVGQTHQQAGLAAQA